MINDVNVRKPRVCAGAYKVHVHVVSSDFSVIAYARRKCTSETTWPGSDRAQLHVTRLFYSWYKLKSDGLFSVNNLIETANAVCYLLYKLQANIQTILIIDDDLTFESVHDFLNLSNKLRKCEDCRAFYRFSAASLKRLDL